LICEVVNNDDDAFIVVVLAVDIVVHSTCTIVGRLEYNKSPFYTFFVPNSPFLKYETVLAFIMMPRSRKISSLLSYWHLPLLFLLVSTCSSFTSRSSISRHASLLTTPSVSILPISKKFSVPDTVSTPRYYAVVRRSTRSKRFMANSNDEGPGLLTQLALGFIILIFLFTSIAPSFMEGGGDRDLSIADSVVTRQDLPGKLAGFESTQDRLSRSTIQEKLSALPVFYLASSDGTMKTDVYISYTDAVEAASKATGGVSVKATSLDQVL
jgi:hypothetical protein